MPPRYAHANFIVFSVITVKVLWNADEVRANEFGKNCDKTMCNRISEAGIMTESVRKTDLLTIILLQHPGDQLPGKMWSDLYGLWGSLNVIQVHQPMQIETRGHVCIRCN